MKYCLLLLCSFLALNLHGSNYFVSSISGADSNSGLSYSDPFGTIQFAADLTNPGDTVFIMDGVYTNAFSWSEVLLITRSGLPNNPIVYMAYPGENPKLEFDGWACVKLENGVGHIEIIGLEIQGQNGNITLSSAINQPGGCNDLGSSPVALYNGNGIFGEGRTSGNNHHITVKDCIIYDCPGAGISMIQSDYITVEGCEIHNNALYSIYGNSGLTFYQLTNHDGNVIDFRNIVRNNRIYDNRMLVPWVDAPCAITDGNGIIMDDFQQTQGSGLAAYTGKTLVENNLVYQNGGRGIHIFISDNVVVRNNSTYKNGQSPEIADGEITCNFANDITVSNNILFANDGEAINSVQNSTNISFDYNVNYNSTSFDVLGPNSILGNDPLFSNPALGDFSITSASPAFDDGGDAPGLFSTFDHDYSPRPQNDDIDVGAYEASQISGVPDILIDDTCITVNRFNDSDFVHIAGDWSNYNVAIFNLSGQLLNNYSGLSGELNIDCDIYNQTALLFKIQNNLNSQVCADLIWLD